MSGITQDRIERIEALAKLQCETYFQLTQMELSERIGVTQSAISQYLSEPYYFLALTKFKRGKIGRMQLKSADLIETCINLGHEAIDLVNEALKIIPDDPVAGFAALAQCKELFRDGKEMAKWLLEKTDPEYAIKLEHVIRSAPAPSEEKELCEIVDSSLSEKLASVNALVDYSPELPEPGNGKSGNGNNDPHKD